MPHGTKQPPIEAQGNKDHPSKSISKPKEASRTMDGYLYDCEGVTERLAQGMKGGHRARVAKEIAAFERAFNGRT